MAAQRVDDRVEGLVAHRLLRIAAAREHDRAGADLRVRVRARDVRTSSDFPMPDTPWTRGKCPFKTLQYLASGMAWIGSAVGENVVLAGDPAAPRGLCASNEDEWSAALVRLVDDAALREEMGRRGRAYAKAHHDRERLADRLAAIWRSVVIGPRDDDRPTSDRTAAV